MAAAGRRGRRRPRGAPRRPSTSTIDGGQARRRGRSGPRCSSALFDQVRTCDNHCAFCFIYQLPPGLRRSLYLKDDDYRLSFLYGNFTTLTRFTEADLERVVIEGLAPLNVSIHATDPDVAPAMLRNRRGATSLRWLRALLDHGVTVHGQVVVCPGVNDGAVLDDTLAGVLDEYPELASLCVVPARRLALQPRARHAAPHHGRGRAVVDRHGETWQDVFLTRARPAARAFAADEYYLLAGRPFPSADVYEGFPMHEDGVGMARTFEREFLGRSTPRPAWRAGFFAWVDGAPAAGYRAAPRRPPPRQSTLGTSRRGRGAPVGILTGEYGARVLTPARRRRWAATTCASSRCATSSSAATPPSPACWSAPTSPRVLAAEPAGHRYLLPDVCLSEGRFLDGTTLADLPRDRRGRWPPTASPCGRPWREPTLPVVAVVGRPNVGKSTLVNRIVGARSSSCEDQPGVTRDRKEVDAEWLGVELPPRRHRRLAARRQRPRRQGEPPGRAGREAGRRRAVRRRRLVGVTEEDAAVAEWLRRTGKPVLLVANKADNDRREREAWEFLSLGLGRGPIR